MTTQNNKKMTLVFIQNMGNQNYTNFRQKQNLKILMHNEICFCSTNFVHEYMLRFWCSNF